MLTCFIPAINLAGTRQPEVSCVALPFLSALQRVESNETKTPIKMHYLAQNCQGFIPHVAACRATWSRVSLLRSCCSAQKKSQQSSFSSQSIQCNSSIIPCVQAIRRTWTVEKGHTKNITGAKCLHSSYNSERLEVACLGEPKATDAYDAFSLQCAGSWGTACRRGLAHHVMVCVCVL